MSATRRELLMLWKGGGKAKRSSQEWPCVKGEDCHAEEGMRAALYWRRTSVSGASATTNSISGSE